MPIQGKLMSTIWIDGKEHKVEENKNLLETILSLGYDLPYFCWHPSLGSVGSCRQCAIKKYPNQQDTQGQIVMACMEPATDGLSLSIEEKDVSEFRKQVIEWLMVNHPHDCPVCDEGGECHLQDMTVMTGHAYRRSRFKKRTHKNQDLGPCINHEMNRCIQCYRCVRFYDDYAGGDDLQVFAAHDHVYFGRHEDGTLESEFSGNLVEVCPTGVFTDKTLKEHYTRKWDLTSAPSVCQHCSLGCNILGGERYGSLRRILSRFNPEVNGYFICDRGRFGYDHVNSDERIRNSRKKKDGQWEDIPANEAIEQLSNLASGDLMGIGSPRASLESNYALRMLVGSENYYNGIGEKENKMLQGALHFLNQGSVRTPSLKEIEQCDAVIVIGEDLTNTAPMLDLALNQSVRVQPLKSIEKIGVPEWNDAAVREYLQDKKGPLYVLTPERSKLDRIATKCFRDGTEELSRLVLAIGRQLDNGMPDAGTTKYGAEVVKEIADALAGADNPLVIAGTSLADEYLFKSAINLANALKKSNEKAAVSFVFPECNSLGTAMLEEKGLEEAISSNGQYETVVILENDLYRRGSSTVVNKFLDRFKNVIVLDHSSNPTAERADLLLAAGTFAEAEGTLVNNEGRAQRFFQVQAADEEVNESWRWISKSGKLNKHRHFEDLTGFDDLIKSIETELDQFKGISQAAPGAAYRINGQKLTRAPHRYSGRTAMFADHSVAEARPPQDEDSPLSFTMEGYRDMSSGATTAFYWSPGWNSAQAINKFRNEVADGKVAGEPGIRLIEAAEENRFNYFELAANNPKEQVDWNVLPRHHIFGSEELSMKSQAIRDRSPGPGITMNEERAKQLNIEQGELIIGVIDQDEILFKVQLIKDWPWDNLGISIGFPGLPYIDSHTVIQLKKRDGDVD